MKPFIFPLTWHRWWGRPPISATERRMDLTSLFESLDLAPADVAGGDLVVRTPIDGSAIARVRSDTPATLDAKVAAAAKAFDAWRAVPPPQQSG